MNEEGKIEYLEPLRGIRGQMVSEFDFIRRKGWYWKHRDGVWYGPFKTSEEAAKDYDNHRLLTGYN